MELTEYEQSLLDEWLRLIGKETSIRTLTECYRPNNLILPMRAKEQIDEAKRKRIEELKNAEKAKA